jgi:hypothetical protein
MSTKIQNTYVVSVGGVASVAVAFPSNVTAGNTIIAMTAANNSAEPVAGELTDTLGHTYVLDVARLGGTRGVGAFHVSSIVGGANTVTYNATGASDHHVLSISEWSGMAASPVSGTGSMAASTSTPTTSSFSPSGAATILGLVEHNEGTAHTITPGATYTQLDESESITDRIPFHAEYKQIAAGTYTADWTLSGSPDCVAVAAAYLDASAVESAGRPGGVRAGW